MQLIKRRAGFFVLLALLLGPFVDRALAQFYFGRNKVQYEDFEFKILKSNNFDLYFYPSERQGAEDSALMLERWYTRFSILFDHEIKSRQPLILYANHADFQQTNVISGLISPGTGGVTEGIKNRIVLPLTGIYADNNHVLGHELVHAFQYDIVKSGGGSLSAMSRLPLWFIEGMAEYLTIGRKDPLTSMWLRDAVLNDDVPSIQQMTANPRYFPYRFGHAFWAFIGGTWGDAAIPRIYSSVMRAGLDSTFRAVVGDSVQALSRKWVQSVKQVYGPQLEGRTKPEEVGEAIFAEKGGLNLAPAISPNGRYVIFLSRRDLFTIDLFLADAQTGKVLDKVASSSSDSHFDALRFIDSAGSWSPNGARFAISVFEDGDNELAIVDVTKRDIERTIKIDDVDAIRNLAWSPDGESIAFFGTSGGIGNLYLYSLTTDSTQQLTDDRFAELQPAWSPDGQALAFATDRGGKTDIGNFSFGKMNIALFDMRTQEIELISMSDEVRHVNPQFSPDGEDLFFIADPDGFSDIFRYSLRSGRFYRITQVATGITGITELSPAMSVAQKSGRMLFSVFVHTDYHVYARDAEDLTGTPISDQRELASNSLLPPPNVPRQGLVDEYLRAPTQGLPKGAEYAVDDYDPSLGLIGVGRTTIGATVDRFGTALGGAVSFLFGDMLGNRILGVSAQLNGGIRDLGGQAVYQNRNHRWNWGAAVGHVPFLTGFSSVGIDTVTVDGERVAGRSVEFVEQRVFRDRVSLMAEYPFSTNRRFEVSTGYTRVSYSVDAARVVSVNGRPVVSETFDVPAPEALNLVETSLAYVGDYSFFGFTSPIRGSRYRFDVEPTFGTLEFLSVLADYRKYFFKNPFTFGIRALHFGRYFGDSESSRLNQLFIGFETFVRGYSVQSLEISECSTDPNNPNACPELDRLFGSRIGVFNAELRVPLFGVEQFGLINFPILPTELTLFFDGGVAWTEDDAPTIEFTESSSERIPVFSAGIAARINLLGAIPLQFYYAYPFQRPQKDWQFGFIIAPGW